MEKEKIDIPEEIQQICREFAKVAEKNNLHSFKGEFTGAFGWGREISFRWDCGRHGQDSNELSISSTVFVHTKVEL